MLPCYKPSELLDNERQLSRSNPIFVAIDTPDLDGALEIGRAVKDHVGGLKLGLEFYTALGPQAVERVAELGLPIFLDLKLHDIPNTVAGAMRVVGKLPVAMVTIHASGGPAMIKAAAKAAGSSPNKPWVLAVTVLTSLDEADLAATGIAASVNGQVLKLGELAIGNGADGLICSPLEITSLRARLGADPKLVVPGIRLKAGGDDQKRTLSPGKAMAAGASRLVIGRPITQAADPASAAREIAATLI